MIDFTLLESTKTNFITFWKLKANLIHIKNTGTNFVFNPINQMIQLRQIVI